MNKVNTKATLHWQVTGTPSLPEEVRLSDSSNATGRRINNEGELVVVSQRFRDQGRNVADCLAKLREMLEPAVAEAPTPRKKTKSHAGLQAAAASNRETDTLPGRNSLRRPPSVDD